MRKYFILFSFLMLCVVAKSQTRFMYDASGNMIIAKTKGVAGNCATGGREMVAVALSTDDTTALSLQGPEAAALKVSPNPVYSMMVIDYYIPENQQAGLQLIDVSGKVISILNIQQHRKGFYRVQYDMGLLANQPYFVTLILQRGKKVQAKVIKQ